MRNEKALIKLLRALVDLLADEAGRNPDFAALARAYGAEGHTVRSLEGFQSAVEAALTASVATVIEVQTDPNIISPRATIDSLRAQSRS